MPEEKDIQTFGRYLRAKRVELGIELEEISNETRIGKDMLQAIENEAHEKLPAEVYVKGFLRAYAKQVGVDADQVVQSYNESIEGFQQERHSERERAMIGEKFWFRFLAAVGLLALIIFVSVYAVSYFQKTSESTRQSATPEKAIQEEKPSGATDQTNDTGQSAPGGKTPDNGKISEEQASPGTEQKEHGVPLQKDTAAEKEGSTESGEQTGREATPSDTDSPAPLVLQIEAAEKTWLKAIIDDEDPKEFILQPGDNLRLGADTQYNLLIGNAGGIRLRLNDKAIAVPGKSGQVVNLMLP